MTALLFAPVRSEQRQPDPGQRQSGCDHTPRRGVGERQRHQRQRQKRQRQNRHPPRLQQNQQDQDRRESYWQECRRHARYEAKHGKAEWRCLLVVPTERRRPARPSVTTLEAMKRNANESSELPGFESLKTGPTGRPLRDFDEPSPLKKHGPARIIALCNQKGGVGKTTTTISLGAALADYGRKVLVIDFDPQGALSAGLGMPSHDVVTIYDLLLGRETDPRKAVMATGTPNLHLIPANIDLSAAEVHLVNEVAREQILARVLKPILDDYDVIFIDCQPSLGLLTVNALTAAHGVLIPLECEYFALRGVALLVETIDKVRDRLNPAIELDGILATMFDSRTLHSREVLQRVVDTFGDTVFETVIGRTVKFPDATVAGAPITTYAPDHPAAAAYRQLARELIARGQVA